MITSNYIRKIFRTWYRKFFWLFFLPIIFGVLSCRSAKNSSPDQHVQDSILSSSPKSPGDFSISPNTFRAVASLLNARVDPTKEKMIYTFLIENVQERGSSLTHVVASGDSIQVESAFSSMRLQKKDEVTIVVEERIQLNSEIPLLILRSIRRK
jgi:hypothetical protein